MEIPDPEHSKRNILVIGASGRAGRKLVEYALEKGHRVTAFARNIDQFGLHHERLRKVQGDVLYRGLIDAAMQGQDIVLSVIGVRQFRGAITLMSEGMANIVASMKAHGVTRLLTITGAGILQENEHTLLMDSLSFPPNLLNLSLDHERVWRLLESSDLNWTVVCPAFMHFGERSGRYLLEVDAYPKKALNEVSVEDVADFMTDEMIDCHYLHKRVGIAHPFQ